VSLIQKVNRRHITLKSRHIACTISGEMAHGRGASSTDSPVMRMSVHKRAKVLNIEQSIYINIQTAAVRVTY